MARAQVQQESSPGCKPESAATRLCDARAKIVEDIGTDVLALAKRARAAGLSTIGHLLETAALEAGAEAAAARWLAD